MTITYRSSKGTDLTPNEVDGNFNDLATRTNAGWRDLVMGFEARGGPNSAVLTNYRNGIYLYAFAAARTQEVFSTAHIDHDYKVGTALYPHIHFTTSTLSSGVVRWGFEYTWAQRRDGAVGHYTFGPTTMVYTEYTVTGESYVHHVSEVSTGGAIDGTNIDVDTVILFRIFRDGDHANDTYPDQVFGFTADLHYQSDKHATPNKAAPFN